MTLAVAEGFHPDQVYGEIKSTFASVILPDEIGNNNNNNNNTKHPISFNMAGKSLAA